mmetsp:Transcript_43488/g.81113  ORF Transcript_43488/g.81113 Transcript_43488/m.81113 type:complete len:227 (-) Transcript_43488:262-942(-)
MLAVDGFDIEAAFHELLGWRSLLRLSLHGFPAGWPEGEDGQHFLHVGLCWLRSSNFKAADPVDAEDGTILRCLRELRGSGWQDVFQERALEDLIHLEVHQGGSSDVGASFAQDLEARGPRAWELGASHSDSEVLIAELRLPLLGQAVLFLDEVAQLLHVIEVGIRRNEGVPLSYPVGHHWVEHPLQQGHVLRLEVLIRVLVQVLQERLSKRHPPFQRVEGRAAGWQ